jgi:membrane protease YdiL (CAAX protease family)
MKIKFFFVFILLFCRFLNAQQRDSVIQQIPDRFPGWTIIVPGGTFFYEGKTAEGITFTALELGGIYLGIKYDHTLKSGSTSPYYNYPLLIALQAYNISYCEYERNILERWKYKHPDFQYDPISKKDLFLAPFKIENIVTPITIGMMSVACLDLWIDGKKASHHWADVRQMYFLDRYIDKSSALPVYAAVSMASAWSAGVFEEYSFRNGVMPYLDYKFGQTQGLIYSSVGFGLMHCPNIFFANKKDYGRELEQVLEATIAGFLLGYDVQSRGHHIGPAVAAHAWYDFILMFGSFLVDPENNAFGVQVSFHVQ